MPLLNLLVKEAYVLLHYGRLRVRNVNTPYLIHYSD